MGIKKGASMAIEKFDRPACREVSDKVIEALKPVAAQLGLSVKKHPGSYSSQNFVMKVEFAVIGEEGVAMTRERQDYMEQFWRFGLKKEWLDKVFTTDTGESYQITGLRTRGKKFPVLAIHTRTKKGYKFPARAVIRAMERENVVQGSTT